MTPGKLNLLRCCAALIAALWQFGATAGLAELWSQQLGSSLDTCPAIDDNGNVYVTCSGPTRYKDFSGGKLVALTPRGKILWEFKTFSDIKSSPAIADDGTIYFGGRDRKLHAVGPGGKEKWSFVTTAWIDSSAAIATNGTVYFGGWDKKFYALNPDGSQKWAINTGGPIDSSPAIAADGTIYFGSHDKNFYALNPDGSQKWVFATGGAIISSPALNCDGAIYFSSLDGNFYVLDSAGKEKWRMKTGDSRGSSPVLGTNGDIFLGINNMLHCLSATGSNKWDFGYPVMQGAAAVSADGIAYFAAYGDGVGTLLAFHLEGAAPSYNTLGLPTASSPAIGANGTVYIGDNGKLFALKADARLAKSCWPKFRGNAAQNGRLEP